MYIIACAFKEVVGTSWTSKGGGSSFFIKVVSFDPTLLYLSFYVYIYIVGRRWYWLDPQGSGALPPQQGGQLRPYPLLSIYLSMYISIS